jgi:hypothetical protein
MPSTRRAMVTPTMKNLKMVLVIRSPSHRNSCKSQVVPRQFYVMYFHIFKKHRLLCIFLYLGTKEKYVIIDAQKLINNI